MQGAKVKYGIMNRQGQKTMRREFGFCAIKNGCNKKRECDDQPFDLLRPGLPCVGVPHVREFLRDGRIVWLRVS